jgi:hypothetical protein
MTLYEPIADTDFSEPSRFLDGEVYQDESMDPCLLAVVQQLLLAVAKDWIIVSHE